MSQGADVVVSEVMNKSFVEAGECAFGRVGDATREAIFRDIQSYHIDVSELATLAEAAGVAHLVLTHGVPSVDDTTCESGEASSVEVTRPVPHSPGEGAEKGAGMRAARPDPG